MGDACKKCGGVTDAEGICPACAVLPATEQTTSPPPKAAVIAAALLPLFAVIVFVVLVAGIGFAGLRMVRGVQKSVIAQPAMIPLTLPSPAQTSTPLSKIPVLPPLQDNPAAPPIPVAPAPPVIEQTDATPPAPLPPLPPLPVLLDCVPSISPSGSPLVIRGEGLAAVDKVFLLSWHGAKKANASIIYQLDQQLIIRVPSVPSPDDGNIIVAVSAGGIAELVDEHTGATPWGTDGHLHDTTMIVHSGDDIATLNNMVVIAQPETEISLGDDCTAFLDQNVILKGRGKRCTIYYVNPLKIAPDVSREGLIKIPAMKYTANGDAFRVKSAPPNAAD